jgi:subtilisin family serine protease
MGTSQQARRRATRRTTGMVGALAALISVGSIAMADSGNGDRGKWVAPPAPGANAPATSKVIPGRYIVTLDRGVDAASAESMVVETRGRGHEVDHVYRALRGFSGRLSSDEVRRLQSDPRVTRVEPDQTVHTLAIQAPAPSWGLDRIDERAPDATSSYDDSVLGTTGAGVTAYVIDTGIYPSSDLAGRIGAGRNFIASGGVVNTTDTTDCNGHGTHVAGTIGGTAYGVAKAVTVVPVRVLDCNGSGTFSGVIAGIDWVTAQHTSGLAVANLSLGGGFSQSVNDAVKRAVDDGVVVAVAAGNSDADACGASPASEPSAITVGATDAADIRASFSNYGSCLDLFAPGMNITSAWIGSASATNTISGTSMASPHVAGAAVLYLAAGKTAADLVAATTTGRVGVQGANSPNKLLYVGTAPCDAASCPPAPLPPANDAFAAAQVVSGATGSTGGSTAQATKEAGEPNHAGNVGGRSIWYRFTTTSSGTATVTTAGSGFDTLLGVYTGSTVGALTQVAANDDAAGSVQSTVTFAVAANTTYLVAVDGWNGAAGVVTLNWTLPSGPSPPSGSTPLTAPGSQSTDTGGDGNGYQTSAGNALADDGVFAVDTNSGTSTSTSCTSSGKDKHRFSQFSLPVPSGAAVKGIEVRLDARADSGSGSPRICVQLSWNGGTSWTTAKATPVLSTAEATYVLGGAADSWGRTWAAAELGSPFLVRVIDVSSSTARDFSLDYVAVRVTY